MDVYSALAKGCPFCRKRLHLSDDFEFVQCTKCTYSIEFGRIGERWLVWLYGPKEAHTEWVSVLDLRSDGYTSEGVRWERFKYP